MITLARDASQPCAEASEVFRASRRRLDLLSLQRPLAAGQQQSEPAAVALPGGQLIGMGCRSGIADAQGTK
jgi:hypothetical protein